MRRQAAKVRRPWAHLVALLSLLVFAALPAQATRTLPSLTASYKTQAPLELSRHSEAASRASEKTFALFDEEDLSLFAASSCLDRAENRIRLFADSGEIGSPAKRLWGQKTAVPASMSDWEANIWARRYLAQIHVDLFFQGAWTDPLTGIAYHRNRWYDPRTASWLSEDPAGAVDSPNLYAFVGWGPHMGTDPLGLRSLCDWFGNATCRDVLWGVGKQAKADGQWIRSWFTDPGEDALASTAETLQDVGATGGAVDDALTREGSSDVKEFLERHPDSAWSSGVRLPDLARAGRDMESAGRHATEAAGSALILADRVAVAKAAVTGFFKATAGFLLRSKAKRKLEEEVIEAAVERETALGSPKSFVRNSLDPLTGSYDEAFEGAVRTRTFKAGDRVYRSPSVGTGPGGLESAGKPGPWFSTRRTVTKVGTESQSNVVKWGNPLQEIRTYEFTKDVTVYYGRVAGGKGYQLLLPRDVPAADVLKFVPPGVTLK